MMFPIAKRSMDIIDHIQNFSAQKLIDNKPRFVILDEADRPSDPGRFYSALQPMIEATDTTLRFILTCNNVHIIPEPIRSRCAPISFSYDANDDEVRQQLHERMQKITDIEVTQKGGTVNEETVKMVIDNYYPDIRAILQGLYVNYLENKGNIDGKPTMVTSDHINTIANFMRQADFLGMRRFVSANIVDFQSVYTPLGDFLIEKIKPEHKMPFAKLLAKYQYRASLPAVDQEINLNGLLAETTMLVHGHGK
jgi:DNA polymerase III delta prime subunit